MLMKVKVMVPWYVLCAINVCPHFYEQAKWHQIFYTPICIAYHE